MKAEFEANKEFGLGFMFGVPTGLSGKYYVSKSTALDFGIGAWGRRSGDRDRLHLHADFLWHPVVIGKTRHFWVPLYFGVGGRFLDHGNDDGHFGIRVPGGIMLDFERTPIDIFLEFAFVFDVVAHDGAESSDFNGALGIRYYF